MKVIGILSLAILLLAGPAAAQQSDWKADEVVTDLGHGMYMLTGTHAGNITLAVGSDGVIAVDTQFAQYYPDIKAKIRSITRLPVKYAIDTHYHADHSSGNESFHKDGTILVAHANVANRLKNPPPGADGKPGTPAPAGAIPTHLYTGDSTTLSIPGVTANLLHPKPAHTDGDTVVIFPAVDVISTGDIVGSNNYPNIDVAVGGSIDGMIAGADFIIAHCGTKTIVVPGHGPVTNRAGVIAYRNMLMTARQIVAKAKAGGMTEKQVMDGHLLASLDAKWTGIKGSSTPKMFPVLIYRSIP